MNAIFAIYRDFEQLCPDAPQIILEFLMEVRRAVYMAPTHWMDYLDPLHPHAQYLSTAPLITHHSITPFYLSLFLILDPRRLSCRLLEK